MRRRGRGGRGVRDAPVLQCTFLHLFSRMPRARTAAQQRADDRVDLQMLLNGPQVRQLQNDTTLENHLLFILRAGREAGLNDATIGEQLEQVLEGEGSAGNQVPATRPERSMHHGTTFLTKCAEDLGRSVRIPSGKEFNAILQDDIGPSTEMVLIKDSAGAEYYHVREGVEQFWNKQLSNNFDFKNPSSNESINKKGEYKLKEGWKLFVGTTAPAVSKTRRSQSARRSRTKRTRRHSVGGGVRRTAKRRGT